MRVIAVDTGPPVAKQYDENEDIIVALCRDNRPQQQRNLKCSGNARQLLTETGMLLYKIDRNSVFRPDAQIRIVVIGLLRQCPVSGDDRASVVLYIIRLLFATALRLFRKKTGADNDLSEYSRFWPCHDYVFAP